MIVAQIPSTTYPLTSFTNILDGPKRDREEELVQSWYRLPNEIKSRIFKSFGLGDLVELARGAPHTAHEILRNRVQGRGRLCPSQDQLCHDMLRDTGSVISGSSTLIVVVPCSFVNLGLDIFCTFDQAGRVFNFLRQNGYGSPQKGGIISFSHLDQYCDDPNFHSSFVIPSSIHGIYHLTHETTGYRVSHELDIVGWCSLYVPDAHEHLPSGKVMVQECSNPYCKRAEREIDDWWTMSMAFTGRTKIEQHPSCITWKLSMQYLGQEVAIPGLTGQTDSAWVAVEGFRKYHQYNAVKAHDAIDPNAPQVNLNEFQ
ncbi:hypothetical protein BKA70DRAFT_1228074 [Coprinopsis sp. MPI-PUGE-AT-0042]|nr:hypothetical protein BKA70DRAFT_1228074 [Coprinopsis sp. MPI-PUGE-AT-0042]